MSGAGAHKDNRQHARLPYHKRLRVKLDSWGEFASLSARDVSEGGVFIETDQRARVGQRISIEVSDEEGRAMVLPGEVVRVASDTELTGVGVRFLPLSDAEREVIDLLMGDARQQVAQGSQQIPVQQCGENLLPALRAQLRKVELGDPFDVLGLRRGATRAEIMRAFDEQQKQWRPDGYPDATDEERNACMSICLALESVLDDALRGG